MRYSIDKTKREPAYVQLYRFLREDIVSGVYGFGTKLPSKRIVAEEVSVSVITVEHAYELLCEEGYAEARQRSGYFVIFRDQDGFASPVGQPMAFKPDMDVPAGNGTFPYSVLAKAMRSVLSEQGERILTRSPHNGCEVLRSAIQKYLSRSRGITAEVGQIVIGSGSEYLYSLLVELLGRNRKYAAEDPSYQKIEQVYRASGVKPEMLPLGTDGIDSAALQNTHATVLHISPYRSFPSGVSASASKRHEYVRWAAKRERYVIEDDFESEFSVSTKPEETIFSLSEKDNVIYMNTFSKTISPSLRVGYMVLPKHLVPVFEDKLGFYSCTVPTYIQYVLAKLLDEGDFERHINRVRRQKRKELE